MTRRQDNKTRKAHSRKGFSLLELTLVVGLSAGILMGVTTIFESLSQTAANKRTAAHMLRALDGATAYIAANFTDISTTEVPVAGDIMKMDLEPLIADGFLPAGFRQDNIFDQELNLYIRNIGDSFDQGLTLEALVMTEDANPSNPTYIPERRMIDIAAVGGPSLGFISANQSSGNIISSARQWSLDLLDFADGTIAPDDYTSSPSASRGGYLAAYARVSIQDAVETDYLYRTLVNSDTSLNEMQANLNMNNFAISNVNTMTVDRAEIGGTTTIQGTNALASASFNVDQMVHFDGDMNVNMRSEGVSFTGGELVATGPGGSGVSNPTALQVTNLTMLEPQGEIIARQTDISSDPNFQRFIAETINANTLNTGDMAAFTVNMGTSGLVSLTSAGSTLQTANNDTGATQTFDAVTTGGIIAAEMEVGSGNVSVPTSLYVVEDVNNAGGINVGGIANFSNADPVINGEISISNLGSCFDGGLPCD